MLCYTQDDASAEGGMYSLIKCQNSSKLKGNNRNYKYLNITKTYFLYRLYINRIITIHL